MQTFFHTKLESEANRRDDTVPLMVNCVGEVSGLDSFFNRNVRQDYYYIYVLKGKMVLEEEELLAGDVIVFEPGYHYQYKNEGDTEYLWVHYTGYEACALTRTAHLTSNVKVHIGEHEEIGECFRKLFREFMIHDEASGLLSVCLLREILYLTGRYAGVQEKSGIPLLSLSYIHRFYSENIEINSLARMEHMSCTSFRSAFKKHTGVSPNEYIITQRISAACQLLVQTDKSISEIAAEVGYGDQYYFSRIFKKKMGVPPLGYRRKY